MPQIGQLPGSLRTICGCIGQTYSTRAAAEAVCSPAWWPGEAEGSGFATGSFAFWLAAIISMRVLASLVFATLVFPAHHRPTHHVLHHVHHVGLSLNFRL